MATGGSNIVVWAWFNDFSQWQAFDSPVSNYIEQQTTLGNSKAYLRNVEPSLAAFYVDMIAMTQTSVNSGNIRPVQRSLFPSSVPAARGIMWQWSGEAPGHWHAYDMESQQILESCAMQNLTNVDLSQMAPNLPYVIDFSRMVQVRAGSGYLRNVRRMTCTPYIMDTGPPPLVTHQSAPAAMASPVSVQTRSQARRSVSMGTGAASMAAFLPSAQAPNTVLKSARGLPHSLSAPTATSGLRSSSGGRETLMGRVDLVPDAGGTNANEVFAEFTDILSSTGMNEECAICLDDLTEQSTVSSLRNCKHCFHTTCLTTLYNSGPKCGSLQCPVCKTMYGFKHGNCPAGSMTYHIIPQPLPGNEHCDTIRIIYEIPAGVQGPEHPEPGAAYMPVGFPRTGYLPNNERGREVLHLLIIAWKRRLTFTVGTSVTTGRANCVVWNEIHHKTENNGNRSGHGYPDPAYLDNVTAELAAQGVTMDM